MAFERWNELLNSHLGETIVTTLEQYDMLNIDV